MNSRRSILLLAGGLAFVLYILPAQLRPANFLPDDAYFYLQVAHNIASGHGSTFNQIMPTNGYHPLWMLFCVVGMFLTGGGKEAAIHLVLALQALLFLGGAGVFIALARRAGLRLWPVALPILATYFLTGLYGSEAHLNGLAILLTLLFIFRALDGIPIPAPGFMPDGSAAPDRGSVAGGSSLRDWSLAGLFAGLAMLARLDNIFLVAAILLVVILPAGREGIVRRLGAFLLPVVAIVAPYLLYNMVAFGHAMPISGAIKSSFPAITFSANRLALLGKVVALFAIISLLAPAFMHLDRRQVLLLRILGAATLLQCAYVAFFMRYGAGWSWYYVAGVLNIAVLLPVLLDHLEELPRVPSRAVRTAAIALVLIGGVLGIARGWYRYSDPYFTQRDSFFETGTAGVNRDLRRDLALWMRDSLPAGSAVMAEEGAGTLAYYSGLRVLPVDGLVADYSYNQEIVRMGATNYLASHGVRYYLGVYDPRSQSGERQVTLVAPLTRQPAGTLVLPDGNIVKVALDHPDRFNVAIWKLR